LDKIRLKKYLVGQKGFSESHQRIGRSKEACMTDWMAKAPGILIVHLSSETKAMK
jgi:hypothetical protein